MHVLVLPWSRRKGIQILTVDLALGIDLLSGLHDLEGQFIDSQLSTYIMRVEFNQIPLLLFVLSVVNRICLFMQDLEL